MFYIDRISVAKKGYLKFISQIVLGQKMMFKS